MQDGERRRHSAGEHSHGDDADGTRRVADEEGGHSSVEHQHQQQRHRYPHTAVRNGDAASPLYGGDKSRRIRA